MCEWQYQRNFQASHMHTPSTSHSDAGARPQYTAGQKEAAIPSNCALEAPGTRTYNPQLCSLDVISAL